MNLLVEKKIGGYAIVTLNRPDKLNALSVELLVELSGIITELEKDEFVNGIIITGMGKAFAAGADIEELHNLNIDTGEAYSQLGHKVLMQIELARFPVIAAVNGFALGGGCELAMACHIRLANEKAKFGQPEVNLGIIPGFGGTQRLTRLVGVGKSIELNLTADIIDASEALKIGLVNKIFLVDELISKSEEMLVKILSKGPIAVKNTLKACVSSPNLIISEGVKLESTLFGETCGSNDFKEGTKAFLEKRNPNFTGK
jgi:enoyl-CoA hydratase